MKYIANIRKLCYNYYCIYLLLKGKNMKKLIALFLITIFLTTFSSTSVFATATKSEKNAENNSPQIETANKPSITMALNEETIIFNDVQAKITAPILVLSRTYVDLYSIAPYLNISVRWIDADIGFFRVNANESTVDFTPVFKWDDLINPKHKFFIKDSKIFVSLRELTDLVNYNLTYTNGLLTIGNQNNSHNEIFDNISTYNSDDYVYTTYPCLAEYVVNPYQTYSYETMLNNANQLQHMYPELIKTSSIGKSVEGRDLLLIEFGRGDNKIFVCGAHHAREYISTTYLMYAIDRYAYAYRTNSTWWQYNPKEILDNVTFCIVPMVNPDGVNLVQNGIYATAHASELANMGIYQGSKYGYSAWKANIRGVDINWNYNKDWSIDKNKNPRGSAGFNGDYPNSEPETAAVSNYVDNNLFDAFLSFHTQGQIFYWADDPENPSYIHQAIQKDTGFVGYEESGTGVGGSFFDYVYRNFKKPTITIELCPYVGPYPYPNSDFDTVWNPTKNILLIVGNEIIHKKSSN